MTTESTPIDRDAPTPRTDEWAFMLEDGCGEVVMSEDCRQLERELAAANARAIKAEGDCIVLVEAERRARERAEAKLRELLDRMPVPNK